MAKFTEVINNLSDIKSFFPLIRTVFTVAILFIIFRLIISSVKKRLLMRAKSKKQLTNIKVFSRALEYFFLVLLMVFAIFSYVGSWAGLGIGLGLLTAAIGFALEAANKYTKDFHKIKHKPFPKVEKPYTRLSFEPSGINVNVRYSVPVKSQSVVSSDITKEVYTKIKKTKDVHLAYPHTEVILRKK